MRPLALVLALSIVRLASAAERPQHIVDWSRRVFPVRGSGDIDLRLGTGRVEVVAAAEGRIVASGTLRTTARDPEVARTASRASSVATVADGDHLVLEAVTQDPPHGATTVELRIEVPPRAQVRIKGKAVHVDVKGLAGALDVKVRSGNLTVELAAPTSIHAQTGGGRIDQDVGLSVAKRGKSLLADGVYQGGGPSVALQTGHGNIVLRPARSP